MLIFLYGPDSYRRQKKLNEIVSKYKERHLGLTIGNFYLDQKQDWPQLKEFVNNQSLFDSFKFGVVRDSFKTADFKELKAMLEVAMNSKNLILVVCGEEAPPKDFAFLLKKPVLAQNFKNLSPLQISEFIEKESEERGLKLNSETIKSLARVYKSDSFGLINELEKMSLSDNQGECCNELKREEKLLTDDNVFYTVVKIKKSTPIFQRLPILEILLDSEDPARIFNLLAFSGSADLKEKLADYDVAVKSGKLDYETALLDLALNI